MSKVNRDVMAMYDSLLKACDEAHGGIHCWEQCEEMTVAELIDMLGPNNVRFVYDAPKVEQSLKDHIHVVSTNYRTSATVDY